MVWKLDEPITKYFLCVTFLVCLDGVIRFTDVLQNDYDANVDIISELTICFERKICLI